MNSKTEDVKPVANPEEKNYALLVLICAVSSLIVLLVAVFIATWLWSKL